MKPEILAPAGDKASFAAALAAGADAVYLGFKHFTARMQAENFSIGELARMAELAHSERRRLYVAVNSLLKPDDLSSALHLIARLERDVHPDALIVQDLGVLELARQAGFSGELHLSTLSNVTHQAALAAASGAGASRVILPRELSIDEIREMDKVCPENLALECFVHGALCWCVSGRCWWSSFLGGKSGLRGRCVQPCRRVYTQGAGAGRRGRWFSCLDLSLNTLVKTLLDIPHMRSWKIEGRKKGPHYVFHVTSAYCLLRDNPGDAQAKKSALDILGMALGRPSSHARFLPQRFQTPTDPDGATSSGLPVGKITFAPDGKAFLKPRIDLLAGDYLRIGIEDGADLLSVTRRVPKRGTLLVKSVGRKKPETGVPVFLIDRREPELAALLRDWERRLAACRTCESRAADINFKAPVVVKARRLPDMRLLPGLPRGKENKGKEITALWLSPKSARDISRTVAGRISWWLPPVIWPDEEAQILRHVREVLRNGARDFVCNAPWQPRLFVREEKVRLLAGPFCNTANAAALSVLAGMGFAGAFVSPELPMKDMLALPRQSCLPLGLVLSGYWPMGISRHNPLGPKGDTPFRSPKNELFWTRTYGQNLWIYSDRPLDLSENRPEFENAGYSFFVHMPESLPQKLVSSGRTSVFNRDGALL